MSYIDTCDEWGINDSDLPQLRVIYYLSRLPKKVYFRSENSATAVFRTGATPIDYVSGYYVQNGDLQ